MDKIELSESIQICRDANSEISKLQSDIYGQESKINSVLNGFIRAHCSGYDLINNYYEVSWCESGFIVSIYYAMDDTLASQTEFTYAKLKKYNLTQEAKIRALKSLEELKTEDELTAIYEILRERFDN